MGDAENEHMGAGQYIGSDVDVDKEYDGEKDEVIWPHRPKKYGEKIDAGEDGRQAVKGQICNELVPPFERMSKLDMAASSLLAILL